jgi:hypothetical protein
MYPPKTPYDRKKSDMQRRIAIIDRWILVSMICALLVIASNIWSAL